MNIFEYDRIIILGNNGSGKSYLSEKIATITKIPLIHLENEFWLPNWEMPSKEEWKKKNIELVSKRKWIIDGNVNHGRTMEIRFKSTDLIIFLDISRLICLGGVLKRYGKKRSDRPVYLEDKLDMAYIQFLKRLWRFPKSGKRYIIDLHKKYPEKSFFVISSRRKMRKLLNQWEVS